ncbi:unnamed protein product [Ceutorhynchus assimilis]|uniref:Uncharacterized protein n=1 Tax=Ceutorhynchus assimilis TaxID=467358 RepID=A0A9N9QSK9_9CUCU|nr:unnamed protein product [Ceutorhynchus assimilis]
MIKNKTYPEAFEDNILEAIFGYYYCKDCARKIMSVPQAAFAAKKVRKNLEKHDPEPKSETRYNGKYMNSIWGMYNRFSVHNLKKIMDNNNNQPQINSAPRLVGSSHLSVSVERLTYLPL